MSDSDFSLASDAPPTKEEVADAREAIAREMKPAKEIKPRRRKQPAKAEPKPPSDAALRAYLRRQADLIAIRRHTLEMVDRTDVPLYSYLNGALAAINCLLEAVESTVMNDIYMPNTPLDTPPPAHAETCAQAEPQGQVIKQGAADPVSTLRPGGAMGGHMESIDKLDESDVPF